jgi:hypothetical protein
MCQEELSDPLACLGRHLLSVAAENLWNVGAKLLLLPPMEIDRSSEGRLRILWKEGLDGLTVPRRDIPAEAVWRYCSVVRLNQAATRNSPALEVRCFKRLDH